MQKKNIFETFRIKLHGSSAHPNKAQNKKKLKKEHKRILLRKSSAFLYFFKRTS